MRDGQKAFNDAKCNINKLKEARKVFSSIKSNCPDFNTTEQKEVEAKISEIEREIRRCTPPKPNPGGQGKNHEDTLRIQSEYKMIVSARKASKPKEKEFLYIDYIKKCTICKDSIEANLRIQDYISDRNNDREKFKEAGYSIPLLKNYLMNCVFCEDSALAAKRIREIEQKERRQDTLLWQKALRYDKLSDYQDYITNSRLQIFRARADRKKFIIQKMEGQPLEMILVNGGKYRMGAFIINEGKEDQIEINASDEKPHGVKIDNFWLDKYEISFELYDLYCEDVGIDLPSDNSWGRNKQPAINVSWFDAVGFCNWLSYRQDIEPYYEIKKNSDAKSIVSIIDLSGKGYRLPTEAEWEYAARQNGDDILFGNGKNIAIYSEMNFYCSQSDNDWKKIMSNDFCNPLMRTMPVNSFAPNKLGFFNMAGNVSEWCWDKYDKDYKVEKITVISDLNNPEPLMLVKGGGWNNSCKDCRVSARRNLAARKKNSYVGFRVARNL
jgi:formylglycine-generating enzyme required for sulfatase activity